VVRRAVEDEAGPDSLAGLDIQHVPKALRRAEPHLGPRAEVGVVDDHDRPAQPAAEFAFRFEVRPTRHDRGGLDPLRPHVQGCGDARGDAAHVQDGQIQPAEQTMGRPGGDVQRGRGLGVDVDLRMLIGQHPTFRRGDGHRHVHVAEVDAQDHPPGRCDNQQGRRSSAPGPLATGFEHILDDQALVEQILYRIGDGTPR
jgi:hypothetical protein